MDVRTLAKQAVRKMSVRIQMNEQGHRYIGLFFNREL